MAEDDAGGEGDKDLEHGEHILCVLLTVGKTNGRKKIAKIGAVVNGSWLTQSVEVVDCFLLYRFFPGYLLVRGSWPCPTLGTGHAIEGGGGATAPTCLQTA